MEENPTETVRKRGRARNLVLHLHPARVRKESIRFTLTFGLGGMAALLFLMQLLTGMLMRFTYIPTPTEAYDSILVMKNELLFGRLVRNLHHWSGILFVIVTFLHLLRTFYTGAFYHERRWNWIIGLVLMVLVVFSNFSGYLLPWDQLAYWAVTVSTAMLHYVPYVGNSLVTIVRGGVDVNSSTLLLFYNFHTAILPLSIALLMAFHFWRVRKNKGVVVRAEASPETVPSDPDLVAKELVTGLALIAFLFILAIFLEAPLQERANPASSPNPAKAAWYFMGVQELLLHFHPFVAAFLIPTAVLVFLISIPYLNYDQEYRGKWFFTDKGKRISVYAMIIGSLFTLALIFTEEYLVNTETLFPDLLPVLANGIIPLIIPAGLFVLIVLYMKRQFRTDKSETVLFVFTFLMAGYAVLSIIGIWFRGPSMEIMWYAP